MNNQLCKALLFISIVSLSGCSVQKDELAIIENYLNQVNLIMPDSNVIVRASILPKNNKRLLAESDRYYSWYRQGTIHTTQGGYDGNLLGGEYVSYYYQTKNIKEKGFYWNGLKNGKWVEWHTNGNLKSTHIWKKGILNGEFTTYDTSGKLTKKGTYLRSKLNGALHIFSNDSLLETITYKKGYPLKSPSK
ncbi:MAG: hypothetical protein WC150_03190 [Bacteroidia bacterium]